MTRYHRYYFLLLSMLVALLFSGKTLAVHCAYINGYSVRTATIVFPPVVIQRDAAPGTVLSTVESTALSGLHDIIQCDGIQGNLIMRYDAAGIPTYIWNGETYFRTGVEGVGVKITSKSEYWQALWNGGALPIRLSGGQCVSLWEKRWFKYCGGSWGWDGHVFQLVKTGQETGTGRIAPGGLVRTSIEGHLPAFNFNLGVSPISTAACSIKTQNIAVELKPILNTHFTHVGVTLGDKPFTIDLTCRAGARINATLSGSQNQEVSNDSVLALSGAGSAGVATGVGIQLLYDNTPLRLNHNIVLKVSSGGKEFPPNAFTARYYQTKNIVTTGDANTTATLNLTYQ